MKTRISCLLLLLVGFLTGMAQELQPLGEMPGLRSGVLPNGLHYYVLHNEKPKGRANFYIAQKVGSTLETQDQLGLAHFLEHMAFNGTKTYPGKSMLNYLQDKGIRFGDDINAYTDFDETVYNIDNVPCADQALMDSVLLVLRDWSCNLLLETTEIDAERGVIQEEWRQRNDAQNRMFTALLPAVYDEYQYERMPIGTMEVVMNFPPDTLRSYYHKWYRPDQQGIVVVGDFDPAAMEKKIIDLFSPIPMPAGVPERTYPQVSDNEKPIVFTFEDPELQNGMIMVSFKYDPIPFEYRNTVPAYLDGLMRSVTAALINNRLAEYSQEPGCKYLRAGAYFGKFYVSKTKHSFNLNIIPKGDAREAFDDAMAVVARACKTGFTDSELERVQSQIIAEMEQLNNEKDNTQTSSLGKELIRHFVDNEPAPGIEMEYMLVSNVLPQLSAADVNEFAQSILTPYNQVIVVSQPFGAGLELPGHETMAQDMQNVLNAEYTAFVDEVITDPLIAALPKPGKIKSEAYNPTFGTTEIMLSNGVKVIVKSTDFAKDEVILDMWREGGKANYPAAEAANVQLLDDAYSISKLGPFTRKNLKKYLAGKNAELGMGVNLATMGFSGMSSVKDLPTLFELVYASFTAVSPDQEYYDVTMDKAKTLLASRENDPMYKFQCALTKMQWGNNPVMNKPGIADIDAANYPQMVQMLKDATANAADFTIVLTGNINLDELRPLLTQYIASLPSKKKKSKVAELNRIQLAPGEITETLDFTTQVPQVAVVNTFSGANLDYTMRNEVILEILSEVLSNNYVTTLREEEGGTYGAHVQNQLLPLSHQWYLMYLFQTNDEKSATLQARAYKEFMELLEKGTVSEEFNKVRLAAIAQLENVERENAYWSQGLRQWARGYDMISGRKAFLENLTLEDFNAAIKDIYNGQNRQQLIMNCTTAQ